LGAGAAGEAVRDVQHRLTALGYNVGGDEPGRFGDATVGAVRSFQDARGLRVDGICGPQTWSALVEAGYTLGDRLLYHRSPPLRGDDVASLQRRLGALGFDAGRVDGIFGIHTATALTDFQRNAGLTTDAICGPATIAALERLGAKAATDDSVAGLREREALRQAPHTLSGRRVVVGEPGGLDALAAAVRHQLQGRGALVVCLSDPDGSVQASQANAFGAELYLGLAAGGEGCSTAYYATQGFVSQGGWRLADLVDGEVAPVLGLPGEGGRPMALPVLRETRMPAVVCEMGPPARVVERTAALAQALTRAVGAWVEAPAEGYVEDPQR